MTNVLGFISKVNLNKIYVNIPYKSIEAEPNNSLSKVIVGNYLGCYTSDEDMVILKIAEVEDYSRSNFNVVEWKDNDVFLVCEIFGSISLWENCFSTSVHKYPQVNSTVFELDDSFLEIVGSAKSKYLIDVGNLLNNEKVRVKANLSTLLGRHIGIFGCTGSGKSRTLASLIRSVCNNDFTDQYGEKLDQDLTPKFIIFDYNDEYKKIIDKSLDHFVFNKTKENSINFNPWIDKNENTDKLSLTEFTQLAKFTPTVVNYINKQIVKEVSIEKIETLLQNPPNHSNYFQNDFNKLKYLLKDLKEKKGKELTNQIIDFLDGKNKVLVLSMKMDSDFEKMFFMHITKQIQNWIVKRQKKGKRRHVNIVLDEAHSIFVNTNDKNNDENPLSHTYYLEKILRMGRKYNCSIIFSSQSPADIPKFYLSQCSNFFLHKTTSINDIKAMSFLGEINLELSSILPKLNTQESMVLGIAFSAAMLIKIRDTEDLANVDIDVVESWRND